MIVLQIDNSAEPVWRCESHTSSPPVTFRRNRYADLATPDRIEKRVHGVVSYYLEVFLTERVLICWTDSPIKASEVSEINTVKNIIQLKTGNSVRCVITDRKPNPKEREFIQQERLIESNYARGPKRGIKGAGADYTEKEEQPTTNQVFNIQQFAGILGNVTNSQVNLYDYSTVHQLLKEHNVSQRERNELENIMDAIKTAPAAEKPSLVEKGKAWIVRNREFLGAGAEIVAKAIGVVIDA